LCRIIAYIEKKLEQEGVNWQDRTLEELDRLWDEAKERNL